MLPGSTILLVAGARLTFDVHLPERLLLSVGAVVLGGLSFFGVGFLLGAVLPTPRSAQATGMILYFRMLFVSGAAMPQFLFPEWLRTASVALPLIQATRLFQDA